MIHHPNTPAGEQALLRKSGATSTANSAAAVTIAADVLHFWCLDDVYLSFKLGSGTASEFSINFGGVVWFKQDITANGLYHIPFPRGYYTGIKGDTMVLTASAAGTNVITQMFFTYR